MSKFFMKVFANWDIRTFKCISFWIINDSFSYVGGVSVRILFLFFTLFWTSTTSGYQSWDIFSLVSVLVFFRVEWLAHWLAGGCNKYIQFQLTGLELWWKCRVIKFKVLSWWASPGESKLSNGGHWPCCHKWNVIIIRPMMRDVVLFHRLLSRLIGYRDTGLRSDR